MSDVSFDDLKIFAETHAPTRSWIESMKDELVAEVDFGSARQLEIARLMMEDLLVCGVAYMANGVLVDPGTIKMLIDFDGNTPLPPLPAYQQVICGQPGKFFTLDELICIRASRDGIYPHSSVERALEIKKIIEGWSQSNVCSPH